ncbi:MAG: hypothetical protein JWR44_3801 [Hymenobacter sp.]|jgi:hypothetical protein|nr:hypothetical protein [Hymenobacter sp.]
MQAAANRRWKGSPGSWCLLLMGLGLATASTLGLYAATAKQAQPAPRLSQAQAAWQFLRAVLRADYPEAYGRLAPEIRRAIPLNQFETSAQPLWKTGRRRNGEIQLYKLGVRLDNGGASRLFYSFSYEADSSLAKPPVLLEVTFRDTASRAVLGFSVRHAATPKPRAVSSGLQSRRTSTKTAAKRKTSGRTTTKASK